MGIAVEFSSELTLREFSEFAEGNKQKEECISEPIVEGETYDFLKKDQRIYWLNEDSFWNFGEMPLVKTTGEGKSTNPIASIKMLEVTHFIKEKEIWTKGKFKVIKIIKQGEIYFNSCSANK
jgi:hypothetical protein